MQRAAIGLSILVFLSFGATVWGEVWIESVSPESAQQGETVCISFIVQGISFSNFPCLYPTPKLVSRDRTYGISANDYIMGFGSGDSFTVDACFTIPYDAQVGPWSLHFNCRFVISPLLDGFTILSTNLPQYGGGSGTPEDPYQIWDANHMQAIGADPCDWDKCFKLMADIDLNSFAGSHFYQIGYYIDYYTNNGFTGVFDGNGYTISNFTYNSHGKDNVGLFGYINDPNAVIKNLGLIDPQVYAGNGVGSLVGILEYGTVTNCYVDGGSISGHGKVGGLVGETYGTITNCYLSGSVSGTTDVGGLVGSNSYLGTITNCYSTGSVTGTTDVGGLVGSNSYLGTITNCYSTGSVSGYYYVGGLVGENYESTINNCYSTGSVDGIDWTGGLVGWNNGIATASFWDIETSGQTTSAGGTGKTTAEMQMAITFVCWGYKPVWTIDDGVDYPRLVWENKPGELITVPSDLYGGGTGEVNDPYLIYTAYQLNNIGLIPCHWDKHFKLMADIDLSGYTGTSFNIIGYRVSSSDNKSFTGVFDGNGHTISNFTYDSNDTGYIGVFGYVSGYKAKIKDLGLVDPNVYGGWSVGSLVGLSGGTITNCYVEGGSVAGDRYVGGLVGYNFYLGTITNCYATGNVTGTGYNAGGLVGLNYRSTINNCYSSCNVSGNVEVGGLVGCNSYLGTITNCYSTGSVTGEYYVGGLAGQNGYCYWNDWIGQWVCIPGMISKCYSTGMVKGTTEVGGLLGYNKEGEVIASFWDVETSEQTTSAGGTGLPTDQMQTMSTFSDAGWVFVGETINGVEDLWFIPQQDYPHLWWEGMQIPMKLTPGRLNCRSEGNWVKAHIILPEGFTVEDVDPVRPAVLHSFGFESTYPLYVFVNKDKLVEIEAAFEREAICSLTGNWPEELTVAGFLSDGGIFLGTSKIRIIHPGMNVIEELAWYWLNADCVHPDFCNDIDMNRDSFVNLLDYALLMNNEVEFVTDE
jgi:hypothetical protein